MRAFQVKSHNSTSTSTNQIDVSSSSSNVELQVQKQLLESNVELRNVSTIEKSTRSSLIQGSCSTTSAS